MKKIFIFLSIIVMLTGCSNNQSLSLISKHHAKTNIPLIDTPVEDFLIEMEYKKEKYIDWENNIFMENNSIYNLDLTGKEKNYYFYNGGLIVTALDNKIVALHQSGFQTSSLDTPYLLLNALGKDYSILLNYEPEIIQTDDYTYFLKWETKNAFVVLRTSWWDGLTDWKICRVWSYCAYKK